MQIIRSVSEMQNTSRRLAREGKRIGLVPTMGYLHEGHLSLMRVARPRVDVLVVSLFVNPTQFAPNEDYSRYPRDFERDEQLCLREAVDILFYPSADDMYRPDASVIVTEQSVSRILEGEYRPTHFQGVLTVVAKLFGIVQPDLAVFGRKDAQQLWLITRMARDLNMPVEIVAAPIVREPDGLAMSSRNVYLGEAERADALRLRRGLLKADERYRNGERNAAVLRDAALDILRESPAASVDYIAVVDAATFQPVEQAGVESLMLGAARFGRTRLIDNIRLGGDPA